MHQEPLLHFLILGMMLFGLFALFGEREDLEPSVITITTGQLEHLAAGFAKTRLRPPDADELAELARDYLREEVYYREAMALGLDRNDTIIRRRLRQKMEFISEDIAAEVEPSRADLEAYLSAHSDDFRSERRFSFRHVYFNPDRHADSLDDDLASTRVALEREGEQAELSQYGDPFLLPSAFDSVGRRELAQQYGDSFAVQLQDLNTGSWQGPIESGFGLHFVFLSRRGGGEAVALDEVYEAVAREWSNQRRTEVNEEFYQSLLGRYTVTVEPFEPHSGGQAASGVDP